MRKLLFQSVADLMDLIPTAASILKNKPDVIWMQRFFRVGVY